MVVNPQRVRQHARVGDVRSFIDQLQAAATTRQDQPESRRLQTLTYVGAMLGSPRTEQSRCIDRQRGHAPDLERIHDGSAHILRRGGYTRGCDITLGYSRVWIF